jgi:nicotinate-nucleotide adenylyltransferase
LKLGILGGSFNPVHLGHLFLADKALSLLKLDRVVMIPAYISPFKLDAENMESSADDRIKMLAAAAAGDSRLAIDDCEIRREGVSYTVDTLEDIISRYMPCGKPSLIIGDDLADSFMEWRNSERILQLADIVIARRINAAAVKYPFPHKLIDNEVINISSQTVRQRISEDGGWRSFVPAGVRAIIEDKRLYGFGGEWKAAGIAKDFGEDCTHANILRVEAAARETLSTVRFLHSRNTALLAQDLCSRFNLDPRAGYFAGIAHDLAKELDGKQMLKLAKSDGNTISALEKGRLNLLHGRAAAVLLRERFCIHNKDILEAVAVHTSGSENMCPLAKVIYIADKAESSRNIDPALRKMCYEEDLDSILFAVLKKTVSKLQSRQLDLYEGTLKLLAKMKERHS